MPVFLKKKMAYTNNVDPDPDQTDQGLHCLLFHKLLFQLCKVWNKVFEILGHLHLGASVGCAVRLETRRSQVRPSPRSGNILS